MVDVDIDINAHDNSTVIVNHITNNVQALNRATQQGETYNDRFAKSLRKVAGHALSAARAVGKLVANVAAIAAVSGPAVSGLVATGKAFAAVGKAGASLAPLLAFVPSLAGGIGLLVGTVKLVKPAFAQAFEPITRHFVDAEGNASAFTKRLQAAATNGVKPLAAEFVKLNMPAIEGGMMRIARQISLLVRGTLQWLNTTRGMQLIKTITEGTASAFEMLQPKIKTLIVNLGDLGTRAGGAGIKALAGVIGRILDRLTAWAANTTVEDITRALKDLSGYGIKLRQVFDVIRDIGRWLAENEGAVKHFSDVVAGIAIAVGLATGAIPAVIAGTVALIINHWNHLKAPFAAAVDWVRNVLERWRTDANRIRITEKIVAAWDALRSAFNEAIQEIGPRWTYFIQQVKAAWETWAPLIAMWWDTSGKRVFKFIGEALAIFIINLVMVGAAVFKFVDFVGKAFKVLVTIVLNVLSTIINGAAMAFGWIPGIGPQLKAAAAKFNTFRDQVNAALAGIDPLKTIRVNAQVHLTVSGGRPGAQGGPGWTALGGGPTSWMRAAAGYAAEVVGRSRVGGPAPITAEVNNTIMLDGKPFRGYTDRVVLASERRQEWRLRNRRERMV